MRSPWKAPTSTLVAGVLVLTTVGITASASAYDAGRHGPGADRAVASQPLVFGHRGAAGYRPEHTAGGYALAASMGVDYLEPDLVPTKDGQLVNRHEPDISATTDVASHPEFANRKRTVTIDGVETTGWFTFDFTLAELETLRAVERLPAIRQHNTIYNGLYRIPTLQDDIDQARALSRRYHRTIGIVPEIKHSTFFASIGLPMERRTLNVLHRNGLDRRNADLPVIVQSFEVGNLQWLHRHTSLPLLQLTSASGAPADFVAKGDLRTYADITSARGLRGIARYATFLGPDKSQIVPLDASGRITAPTTLVRDAHRAGLRVAPYTFRNENTFLPSDFRNGTNPADYGNVLAEYELYLELGVDGVFSDNGDTAVLARQRWIARGRPHYDRNYGAVA